MVLVSTFNFGFFGYAWRANQLCEEAASDEHAKVYLKRLRLLAVPFVLECAWRSVFPSVYNSRQTFFDTPLNSILVDRTLAAIGEVAWMGQVALALAHLGRELQLRAFQRRLFSGAGGLIVAFAVIGEVNSYLGTATGNCLFEVIEESFWTSIYILMMPCGLYLYLRCRRLPHARSAINFSLFLFIQGFVMLPYQCGSYVPMYYSRWRADEAHNVEYRPFWSGLLGAASQRHVTRDWEDWKSEWIWMSVYFSGACWTSILLLWAPRGTSRPVDTLMLCKSQEGTVGLEAGSPASRNVAPAS